MVPTCDCIDSVQGLMSDEHTLNLLVVLVLLLPFLRLLDAKTSAENISNSLQGHTFAFWKAE